MTISFHPGAKPPRTRPPQIRTFRGALSIDRGYLYLEPRRGADILEIDSSGTRTREYRDPNKGVSLNIGDRALVLACDGNPDLIAAVEILFVDRGGWRYEIRVTHGELPPVGDVEIRKVIAAKIPKCTLDFSIV